MRTLDQLHPKLRAAIIMILAAMAEIGYPMMVTDTIRTADEQKVLFAKGRSIPGSIVTNCDGIIKRSNHQLHADGFGHAVDCCFVVNGAPSWDEHLPWKAYGALGVALGLAWGGDWPTGSLHDLPHLELLESIGQRV